MEPFAVFGWVCGWSVVVCWGGVGFVAAVLSDGFGFVVDHAYVDVEGVFVVLVGYVSYGEFGVEVVDVGEDVCPGVGGVFVEFLVGAEGLEVSAEGDGFFAVHDWLFRVISCWLGFLAVIQTPWGFWVMPLWRISSGVRQRRRLGPCRVPWSPMRCMSPAVVLLKLWWQATQCWVRFPSVRPQVWQVCGMALVLLDERVISDGLEIVGGLLVRGRGC